MSSVVLMQVYLEPAQKQALSSQAKKSGRKVSAIMRDAVDAAIAGVTLEEIQTLDMGIQHASYRVNSAATRNAWRYAQPAARTG